MKYFTLKNKTNTQLYIEDLGISLSALGSSAKVNELDLQNSRSLQEVKSLLEISPIREINCWPFNKRNQELQSVLKNKVSNLKTHGVIRKPDVMNKSNVIEDRPSELNISISPIPDSLDSEEMSSVPTGKKDSRIDELIHKMSDLIEIMGKNAFSTITPRSLSTENFISNSISSPVGNGEEPMFILSKIMPEEAVVNVTLHQEEKIRPDIDEASESLKRLRHKNKMKNKK